MIIYVYSMHHIHHDQLQLAQFLVQLGHHSCYGHGFSCLVLERNQKEIIMFFIQSRFTKAITSFHCREEKKSL